MNNLTNEFVWEVKSIQKRSNQFLSLQRDLSDLKQEMEEMKRFFTERIIHLENEYALLSTENMKLRKELKQDCSEQPHSGVLFQKSYLNLE